MLKQLSVLTHILVFTASLMLPAAGIIYYFIWNLNLIESQSGSLAQANNMVRDVDELEIFIQQSMTTSDLIYTSGQVYLVDGALRQNALVSQRLENLKIDNPKILQARAAMARVRSDLESLPSLDEYSLNNHVNAYLATYDAELEIVIDTIASLRAQSDVRQSSAREEYDRSRARLDREQWLSGAIYLVYLLIILRVHLNQFVRPIRHLSENAQAAVLKQGSLEVSFEGPAEYQLLSASLEAFDRRLAYRMQIQRLVSSLSLQLMKNVNAMQIPPVVVETTRSILECDDVIWCQVPSDGAQVQESQTDAQRLQSRGDGNTVEPNSLPFTDELRCCFSRGAQPLSMSELSKGEAAEFVRTVAISDVLVCVSANGAPLGFLQISGLRIPARSIENLRALQQISDIIALVYEKALIDQELEARVLSRTRALSLQTEIAQTAQRAQSSFLTTLSHEIRTPFNTLSGMAQMLSETTLDSEQTAAVESIIKGSDRLLQVISAMFDYAMLDSGKAEINWSRLSIDNFAREIESGFSAQATQAGCDFRVETPGLSNVEVETDPRAVRKIAQVLIDNALRYGRGHPVVCTIESRPLASDRHCFHFVVTDQGPGIPHDSKDALFEPFVQGGEVAQGGLGLGLATAQRYARLLGGLISHQALSDGGSRFELSLDCVLLPPLLEYLDWVERLSAAAVADRWVFYIDQEILNVSNIQSFFHRLELPLQSYDSIDWLSAQLDIESNCTAFVLTTDELAPPLLRANTLAAAGSIKSPRLVRLLAASDAADQTNDAKFWRSWLWPLSIPQVAQDVLQTTQITYEESLDGKLSQES